MKSEEARIAEAIAALTARLESWQVDDAREKATEYVRDMIRNGWRPRALSVVRADTGRPDLICLPTPEYQAARTQLAPPLLPRAAKDRREVVPEREVTEPSEETT